MTNSSVSRNHSVLGLTVLLLSLYGNSAWAEIKPAKKPQSKQCVTLGNWSIPGAGQTTQKDVIARAAKASVVLLGETHVNPEHHRWQLQTWVT